LTVQPNKERNMKKAIAALMACALILPATAATAAPTMHHTTVHKKVTVYRFAKGQRFDRHRAQHYARLDYRRYKRLSAPPRGYIWVRSGDDALLVRSSNNVILRVIDNVFR
jgi:Ni/Co efflux regulator RcnB